MSDDNNNNNDIKNNLKKFKPKKPKITVPADFLDGAKSYDDKLMLVKYLTEKEKKADRTKYSVEQTQEMVAMWKSWVNNPSLYSNQAKFAEAVNLRFGTSKAPTSIIKHIKKSL